MALQLQPQASLSSISSKSSSFFAQESKFLAPKPRRILPSTCTSNSPSPCKASWEELAGVLVFSAIPFTAVKAIANSPLGETLQRRLEERKKVAFQESSKFKDLAAKARKEREMAKLVFVCAF